jgi:hypothetical protein
MICTNCKPNETRTRINERDYFEVIKAVEFCPEHTAKLEMLGRMAEALRFILEVTPPLAATSQHRRGEQLVREYGQWTAKEGRK